MNNEPILLPERIEEDLRQDGLRRHTTTRRPGGIWRSPSLLMLFTLVVFWKLVLNGEYSILVYPDSSFQTYPWSQYIAQILHQGSFPFWDNYTDAGRSFIGETQTGAFYPFNLLMAALPLNARGLLPVSVIEGFIILHCFLASLFMYALARHFQLSPFSSCVAGLVFAFSGSVGLRASAQVNLFYASIWVPAIFWCYSKSLKASDWPSQLFFSNVGGLTLALSLLAGHHQPFIYSSLALVGIALALCFTRSKQGKAAHENSCRPGRVVSQTLLLLVFAAAYASVQLLPSVEYSTLAYRWVDSVNPSLVSDRIPYSIVGLDNALSPHSFLLMIFPYISGAENSPYFGILPLLLVPFAFPLLRRDRIVRLTFLLVLLCSTLAMGYFSPLHGLFYALVPGFDKGREAGRIFLLAHFGLSLLAGFGCQVFCQPIKKEQRWGGKCLVRGFFGFSMFVCLILFGTYFYEVQVLSKKVDYGAYAFACLLLLATSAVGVVRILGLARISSVRIAIVLILLFDFHFVLGAHIKPKQEFDRKLNFEPKRYYQQDDLIQFLRSQNGMFRVDFRDEYYPKNAGQVFKLETINGYGATSLKQFYNFQAQAYPTGNIISDLLNVKYIVSQKTLELPVVFQNAHAKVYENPGVLPRAWLVGKGVVQRDLDEIVELLRDPSFDPYAVAYLEPMSEKTPSRSPDGSSGDVVMGAEKGAIPRYSRISPNRFLVDTDDPSAKWLVVSQNWYPGWKARVDGQLRTVERINGALLGVFLGAGKHQVEFYYRPTRFYWAVGLMLAASACLALAKWKMKVG